MNRLKKGMLSLFLALVLALSACGGEAEEEMEEGGEMVEEEMEEGGEMMEEEMEEGGEGY